MEKYGAVLDSVAAKQEQLTAKFQEFYNNLFNSEVIAGLLELGKGFMDAMNWADGLVGKIILVIAALTALNYLKTASILSGMRTALVQLGKALIDTATGAFTLNASFINLGTSGIGQLLFSLPKAILGLIGLTAQFGFAEVKALGLKGALDLLNINPVMLALSALIAVVAGGVAIFNHFNVTLEEQHEKAKQVQSDYTEIKKELQGVNDELKTTKERIDELNGKDKLTLTEKEELEQLKEQNAELEKRAYWLEQDAKAKQKETTKEASGAWDKDFNDDSEYYSKYKTHWEKIGNEPYEVNDKITETEHIKEQIQYYGELEQQIKELSNKRGQWTKSEKEQYDSLIKQQKDVEEYLKSTGSRIQTDFIDAYPDVDPSTMQGWKDLQQIIYDCLNPPTKESQLTKEIEKLPKTIQDNLKKGGLKDLKEAFNLSNGEFLQGYYDRFIEFLDKIGISADDATYYLNEMAKSANAINPVALESFGTVIDNVVDKAKAIGNAQKDMNEYGYLNIDTIKSLEKQFGDLTPYLTETAEGFILTQENIDTLNSSVLASYELSYNEALTGANNIIEQESLKAAGYDTTTMSIKEQLKAMAELAKANAQVKFNEKYNERIAMGDTASEATRSLGYILEDGTKTAKSYEDAIANIENSEKNLEKARSVLKNLSKAQADKGGSSSSSTNKVLSQAKDNIKSLESEIKILDSQIKALGDIDTFEEYDKQLGFVNQKSVILNRNISAVQQMIAKTSDKETLEYLQEKLWEYKADLANIKDTINSIRLNRLKLQLEDLQKPIDNIDNAIKRLGEVNTVQEKAKQSDLLAQKFRAISNSIATINKLLKDTTLSKDMRDLLEKQLQDLLVDKVGIRDDIESNVRESIELEKKNAQLQAELDVKKKLYELELSLYGKQGKDLYEHNVNEEINRLQKIIDARNEEKDVQDKITEEQEYQNKLLEAKINLQNALNNKTTKILTRQEDGTWQYEYSANMADVKQAQEDLKEAQKNYDDWKYEQETDRIQEQIDAIQTEMDEKSKAYEDMEFHLNQSLEAQTNAIEEYYADIEKITQERMNSYQKVYGDAWDKVISIAQTKLDKLSDLNTKLEGQSEYAFETVGKNNTYVKKIQSFDTGGTISGNGVAFVHDKERVLTEKQNYLFEQIVSKLPQLTKLVNITKLSGFRGGTIGGITNNSDSNKTTIIDKVICSFPNINTTDGLQRAILDLPRLALQQK